MADTAKGQMLAAVDRELHDLSQPLTSLMCHLEMGQILGDAESMAAAVENSLLDCRRVFEGFAAMRKRFLAMAQEEGAQR